MDPELVKFLMIIGTGALMIAAILGVRLWMMRSFHAVSKPGAGWLSAQASVERVARGQGSTNGVVHTRVDLLVTPESGPQYRTFTERALILRDGELSVGQQVSVRFDPRHPEMVYLEDPY